MVSIDADGLCLCNCGSPCPLGKAGMQTRCTEAELGRKGIKTVRLYGDRCDFCLRALPSVTEQAEGDWMDETIKTLHYKFGAVTLCRPCYDRQGNNVR